MKYIRPYSSLQLGLAEAEEVRAMLQRYQRLLKAVYEEHRGANSCHLPWPQLPIGFGRAKAKEPEIVYFRTGTEGPGVPQSV